MGNTQSNLGKASDFGISPLTHCVTRAVNKGVGKLKNKIVCNKYALNRARDPMPIEESAAPSMSNEGNSPTVKLNHSKIVHPNVKSTSAVVSQNWTQSVDDSAPKWSCVQEREIHDFFISYRVSTDANIAQAVYEAVKLEGLHAYWDKMCLVGGQKWKQGFLNGLKSSRVILLLVSEECLSTLKPKDDNVLLEIVQISNTFVLKSVDVKNFEASLLRKQVTHLKEILGVSEFLIPKGNITELGRVVSSDVIDWVQDLSSQALVIDTADSDLVSSLSQALNFVATTAYTLAKSIPAYGQLMILLLKEDSIDFRENAADLFEKLVVEPLLTVHGNMPFTESLVFLLDALDECGELGSCPEILNILCFKFPKLSEFSKVIVTSRPVNDIVNTLNLIAPVVIELKPSDLRNVKDAKILVKARLSSFVSKGDIEAITSALVKKSEGLFMWLVMALNALKETALTLDNIENLPEGLNPIYELTFKHIFCRRTDNVLTNVLSQLGVTQEPLSHKQLAAFLDITSEQAYQCCTKLQSVLSVNERGCFAFFHKSVVDFLRSNDCTDSRMKLNYVALNSSFAIKLIDIAYHQLHKGISGGDSTFLNPVFRTPSDVLSYSCLFWPYHFFQGFLQNQEFLVKIAHNFCVAKLPFFLEAVLALGKLNNVFIMVQSLSDVFSDQTHLKEVRTVISLLNDLKFVAINFRNQLLVSPLQVYNHALIAVPQETVYYQLYQHLASAHITIGAEKDWGPITLVGHSMDVFTVACSPDSKTVVSGSWDKTVKLWSVETGECIKTFRGHSDMVFSVAFSPDSKAVGSGSIDKTVKLWSVETGECVMTLVGHSKDVSSVAFSLDSKFVVSGSKDRTVKLWQVKTGENPKTFVGHSKDVLTVAFSPDSKTVVSGSNDNTVKFWSVETGECIKTFFGDSCVYSVAFSPDSKTLVSGSDDKTVKLWSVETGECVKNLRGHSERVNSVKFSFDSKTVVSGSKDRTIKLWTVETGECVKTFVGHEGVNAVELSTDSEFVVSGSKDRTVKLWQVETGEPPKTFIGHSKDVLTVAFSPDSKMVVSGSNDNTIKLWSVETGECVQTFVGHSNCVTSVAFLPDSKTVVSGSDDRRVKVWCVETGMCAKTFVGHSEGVTSVALSPDSKAVVSGSGDKTVKMWSFETGECLETRDWDGGNVSEVFFPSE
ncbi:hypothetical protein HDU99_002909, partial [Rhizoclosmatium hyalinum]